MHLAVVLAAAVATAVLTGALLVGDSVRGSLRDLALERLGLIDDSLIGQGFFREDLAAELPAARAAPLVVLRGSASLPDDGTRASKVQVLGIDERFEAFFGDAGIDFRRAEGQLFPSVALNESLAAELGAEVGDVVVLSVGRFSEIPRDSLMGDSDPSDLLATLRLTLRRIVPDRGLGLFSLESHQRDPFSAFVALPELQRVLDERGRVNGVVRQRSADGEASAALQDLLRLEDLGLVLENRGDHVVLESRELVLRPSVAEVARRVAREVGAEVLGVQSYLANRIRSSDRSIPYSMVAAADPLQRPADLALLDEAGEPLEIAADGILLNRWAADDLGLAVGDEVELEYYVVGPREELHEERLSLRFDGVVGQRGMAGDRSLTPEYPGLQDVDDMRSWNPPFPVDLARVRSEDEDYWDAYGATPKAFVAAATGREHWSTRYGTLTSLRLAPADGGDLEALYGRYEEALREALAPSSFGFEFRNVREEALQGARGSSDFSGLFIGFSFFLIVSAGLLIALLFRLGVEQRAAEVGLLAAVGFPARVVRRRFLNEGLVLAATGAALGLVAGVLYGGLMMWGLTTLWVAAVGSSRLTLHVVPASLVTGFALSILVILASITGTLRWLGKAPAAALLAGHVGGGETRARGGRLPRLLAWGGLLAALAQVGYAFASGQSGSPALAFGTGSAFLISGLAFFALYCRGSAGRGSAALRLSTLAARNLAWSPGRSLLSVALIASASFVIVTVASNHRELGDELADRGSASGGFALMAESDVPLHQSLDRKKDRFDLGFSSQDFALLDQADLYPMRVLPGDDASCLNLYRPSRPTLLGLPSELVQRGGFSFFGHVELPAGVENPWELLETTLEDGVVPAIADANSAQWILHLGLGDELEIENDAGEVVRIRLVGLLARSVLQSEVLIGEAAFLEHFPERSGYAAFLVDADKGITQELAALLESRLDRFGFDATTTHQKLLSFLKVEHTYLSTFQLLGGLGLLLGTLGLAIVLLRNVVERRGELATLRAVGFPRRSLVAMVLAENAFLLATGLAIGTVSALLAVAPVLAEIQADWAGLATILLAVFAFGMLASAAAAALALRTPLLPALKEE